LARSHDRLLERPCRSTRNACPLLAQSANLCERNGGKKTSRSALNEWRLLTTSVSTAVILQSASLRPRSTIEHETIFKSGISPHLLPGTAYREATLRRLPHFKWVRGILCLPDAFDRLSVPTSHARS
jgi:hypothetical protein